MTDELRAVVDVVGSKVSCSAPNTPVTKHSKLFPDRTPILKVDIQNWKQGVPTPINEGSLTPNHEAFGLLTGFAAGSIRMKGDIVQHLPVVQGNKTISDSLQEIPWYSPKRKKTDGSVIHSKKAKIAKKEQKKHVTYRTQIPDSEIRPENIIPGSPEYIPYKKVKTKRKRC